MTEAAPGNRYDSSIPRQKNHQINEVASLANNPTAADLRVVEPVGGRERSGVDPVGHHQRPAACEGLANSPRVRGVTAVESGHQGTGGGRRGPPDPGGAPLVVGGGGLPPGRGARPPRPPPEGGGRMLGG